MIVSASDGKEDAWTVMDKLASNRVMVVVVNQWGQAGNSVGGLESEPRRQQRWTDDDSASLSNDIKREGRQQW